MTFGPDKLESAIARLEALPESPARAAAREAMSAVLELHAEGLGRLLEKLRDASEQGPATLEALAEDPIIANLLLLHGLHPRTLEARVQRALNAVCAAHGAATRAEIVSIDSAAVRLRVAGSERLRIEVKRAVSDAAPEVEHVEVLMKNTTLVPLDRLVRKGTNTHEQCGLCGQPLAVTHEHLFDVERRRLECACQACSVLFDGRSTKLRRLRREARALDLRVSEAQWEKLNAPVGLVFFSYSSSLDEVIAMYPGPFGLTESVVAKSVWESLVHENPVLAELAPDTSALVVDRLTGDPTYHVLSMDECYRLTGAVRSRWSGLTGGDGPIEAVKEFFSRPWQESP